MKSKIMIVEDEVLIGMMIKRKVEAVGYQVCDIPTSGEQAIEQAFIEKPDMLIMDVCLAGQMSGIEAARQIKKALNTPIVFFTGNNTDKTLIEQSKDVNPVAIVDKMGSINDLFSAIEEALA